MIHTRQKLRISKEAFNNKDYHNQIKHICPESALITDCQAAVFKKSYEKWEHLIDSDPKLKEQHTLPIQEKVNVPKQIIIMSKETTILSEILRLPQDFYHKMIGAPRKAMKAFHKDHIGLDDFCYTNEVDEASDILEKYQAERKNKQSMNKVLFFVLTIVKQLRVHIALVVILSIFATIIDSFKPLAMKDFLNFTEPDSEKSYTNLLKCIGVFVLTSYLESVISSFRHARNNQLHLNMHNQVKTLLFNKFIKLSRSSKKNLETGSLLSQYHSDTGSLGGLLYRSIFCFVNLIRLFTSWYYLSVQIGSISNILPILVLISIIFKQKSSKAINKYHKKNEGISEKISKYTNEYVSGIRVLKYYGWEDIAIQKIAEQRKARNQISMKADSINWKTDSFLDLVMDAYTTFTISFLYASGFTITLPLYLFVKSMIDIIRSSVWDMFYTYNDFQRSYFSLQRLTNLLESQEKEENLQRTQNVRKGQVIIRDAKFCWNSERAEMEEKERKFLKEEEERINKSNDPEEEKKKRKNSQESQTLKEQKQLGVNLEIKEFQACPGEIIGVVGKVGSGKSTLISAIIQEITKLEGQVKVGGSMAYCPQTPWLMNESIKSNILFKSQLRKDKYEEVLKICELLPDLEVLEKGDETIVGEKGVKLSGGQKQRISIARCLYSEADIQIFDDCLSALDAGTAKNVFLNGIMNDLHRKGKTVIISLNALDYLRYCDKVVLIEDAKIQATGKLQEVEKVNESFFKFLSSKQDQDQNIETSNKQQADAMPQFSSDEEDVMTNSSQLKNTEKSDKQKQKDKKTEAENQEEEEKKQKLKIEKKMKINQGIKILYKLFSFEGISQFLTVVSLLAVENLISPFTNWFIGCWFNDLLGFETNIYISLFFSFTIVRIVFRMLREYSLHNYVQSTLLNLNKKFMGILFKSNMGWFDSKSTGEIIERSLNYQDELGWRMHWMTHWSTSIVMSIGIKIFFIFTQAPLSMVIFAITYFVFSFFSHDFANFNYKIHEVSQHEGEKFGSFLQESITGTYVIRAFNKSDEYEKRHYEFHSSLVHLHSHWNRVMGTHKQLINTTISMSFIAVSAFIMGSSLITSKEEQAQALTGIMAGLGFYEILGAAGLITQIFDIQEQMIRTSSKIRKIFDWIENCPQEKSHDQPVPEKNWLSEGKIQAKDLSFRYKENLPIVIKNISFDIASRQKIGVFGRTGSGKSTLTLGFLRILEKCQNEDGSEGKIMFDNTDISEIGLKHLRHSIAMIPQDPLLFSGTIRSNIDPYNEKTDEEIEACLKKVMIWDDLKENEDEEGQRKRKIECKVDGEGENFSLGQRQLLCLARALIRNPKVLLLDEATASIDMKTDNLIQQMLEKEFKNTTVITIAHRLNTIIGYDKILALKEGEIAEFDTPENLLNEEEGYFCHCVKRVGRNYFKKMKQLASKTSYKPE